MPFTYLAIDPFSSLWLGVGADIDFSNVVKNVLSFGGLSFDKNGIV